MNFIDEVMALTHNGEVKECSKNIMEDIAEAVLGNAVATGKIMLTIMSAPFFVREQLFWSKLSAFLDGVYLPDEDRGKLRAKLMKNGAQGDNPLRLIQCIDHAESQLKIRYLINATRCLLTDFIDLPAYFRICHAITYSLDEDLKYLRDHIEENDISYNLHVQGLLTAGLMYQSVIDENDDSKYSFIPFARKVDMFAVSYDDVNRYPNPRKLQNQGETLPVSLGMQEISEDEVGNLFMQE